MPLLSFDALVAVLRAALVAAGIACATALGDWRAATACFAALAAMALIDAREARRAELLGHAAIGDVRRVHEQLAVTVAADPRRLALLTLDVDRFKEIDERFGHLDGDRLVEEVARALEDTVPVPAGALTR